MEIIVHGDVHINTIEPTTSKNVHKIRTSAAMGTWKKRIKSRDNVCQCCGDDANGHLEVHHIMPLAQYRQLGSDDGNGIALCQKCHKQYHNKYNGSENAVTFAKFMRDKAQGIL